MKRQAIAKRLVKLRADRPRKVIADMIGVSVSAISMYENGQRIPEDDIKIKIAQLYNKTVDEIFYT